MISSKTRHVAILLAVIAVIFGCAAEKSLEQIELETKVRNIVEPQGPIYLAHNIWYDNYFYIESINFKALRTRIPAGTEVEKVKKSGPSPQKNIFFQYIIFNIKGDSRTYNLVINPDYQNNPNHKLTLDELVARTFTVQPFEDLTKGLKDQEIENIRRGTIQKGMSKKAVLISWGYPPLHYNFDLNDNEWMYWKKRVLSDHVRFDGDDRVLEASWYGVEGNPYDRIE